jgi:glycosyltransferase involved in cell wall biosynthesis
MKISIITVNLNNGDGLEKTIQSVLQQQYANIEYIVIDANSQDRSKDILKKYEAKINYWVSEPDNGIYNAMNKGIKVATGKYLLFLNSGDCLASIQSISSLISINTQSDIIYGNLKVQNGMDCFTKYYPTALSFKYFMDESLPHPATAISKNLLTQLGLYNEELKIVADWEFLMNAICLNGASYHHVNEVIAIFNLDGISSNPKNKGLIQQERTTVLNKYYSLFLPDYEKYIEVKKELAIYKTSSIHKLSEKIRKLLK